MPQTVLPSTVAKGVLWQGPHFFMQPVTFTSSLGKFSRSRLTTFDFPLLCSQKRTFMMLEPVTRQEPQAV